MNYAVHRITYRSIYFNHKPPGDKGEESTELVRSSKRSESVLVWVAFYHIEGSAPRWA